jgi:hypothetical protein
MAAISRNFADFSSPLESGHSQRGRPTRGCGGIRPLTMMRIVHYEDVPLLSLYVLATSVSNSMHFKQNGLNGISILKNHSCWSIRRLLFRQEICRTIGSKWMLGDNCYVSAQLLKNLMHIYK